MLLIAGAPRTRDHTKKASAARAASFEPHFASTATCLEWIARSAHSKRCVASRLSRHLSLQPPASSLRSTALPQKTAITPTREENYPEWYQQVVKAADLAENSD